jgi:DNA modification methylase
MSGARREILVTVSEGLQADRLGAAYRSTRRVTGMTHGLYRYPARFSPEFVGAVLDEFTKPGEWVLDPFLGGATSAVEALASGRAIAGFDLNPLALLLARAKTTPLYRRDKDALRAWASQSESGELSDIDWTDPRLRNAPSDVVRTLSPWVRRVEELQRDRQRDAARALLLDVGQAAIDGLSLPKPSKHLPSMLGTAVDRLLVGIEQLMESLRGAGVRPSEALYRRRILRVGDARQLAAGRGLNRLCGRFGLVVTSPPYPGVHVLYHRWQVQGRRETPMGYWLTASNDGLGPKHYTMGGRTSAGEAFYFTSIEESWRAIRRLLRPRAFVVQLLAFADADRQLPRYLEAMDSAGYSRRSDYEPTGWRDVPNRRWYYRVQPDRAAAREVLLVHQVSESEST